jgi:hypothetical protein
MKMYISYSSVHLNAQISHRLYLDLHFAIGPQARPGRGLPADGPDGSAGSSYLQTPHFIIDQALGSMYTMNLSQCSPPLGWCRAGHVGRPRLPGLLPGLQGKDSGPSPPTLNE